LSAALKLLTNEKAEVAVQLTPEDPLRAKKRRNDVRTSGRKYSGPMGSGGRSGGKQGRERLRIQERGPFIQ
jgi:ATP-dependent RNA helicase DeaD